MQVSFAKILSGTVLILINVSSCYKLILGQYSNSAFLHVLTVSWRDRGIRFWKDTGPPVSSLLPLLSSPNDSMRDLLDEAIRLRKRAAEIRDQATMDERALVEERVKGAAPSRRRFHEFLGISNKIGRRPETVPLSVVLSWIFFACGTPAMIGYLG